MANKKISAFTAKEAAAAANITYRQLDTWVRAGIVEPDVYGGKGTGNVRLFSFNNIVGLHLASMAGVVGCGLDEMREIVRLVSDEMSFNFDGKYDDVYVLARGGKFYIAEGADAVNAFARRQGIYSEGEGPGVYISIGDTVREVKERLKMKEAEATAWHGSRVCAGRV